MVFVCWEHCKIGLVKIYACKHAKSNTGLNEFCVLRILKNGLSCKLKLLL